MSTGEPTSNGDFLIREVQEDGHDDIAQDLAKAEEIKARFGGDSPEAQEIRKKYDELRLATIGALRNLRIETSQELDAVRKSLTGDIDFSLLAEQGDISESEKSRITELATDLQESVQNSGDTDAPDIGVLGGIGNTGANLLLGAQYGFGIISNGYTDTHVLGYNNTQGNYVLERSEFENILQTTTPEEWNSTMLVNYFSLLQEKGELTIGNLKTKIGLKNLILLGDLWKNENTPKIARESLEGNSDIAKIISKIDSIEDYSGVIQNTKDVREICEGVLLSTNMDENTKEGFTQKIKEYLKKNIGILEGSWKGNIDDSNPIYKEILHEIRMEETKKALLENMQKKYKNFPDILSFIDGEVSSALQNQNQTNIVRSINTYITELNISRTEENERLIPHISGNETLAIQALLEVNSDFDTAISALTDSYIEIDKIQTRIDEIDAILESTSLSSLEIAPLKSEKRELQKRLYSVADISSEKENEVDEIAKISEELFKIVSSPEFDVGNFLKLISESKSDVLENFITQVILDISSKALDSKVSNNLGDIPLSNIDQNSPLYEAVKKAKTQEYTIELRDKMNTLPEIQESRTAFLTIIQEKTGLNETDAIQIFDALVEKIEQNPTLIDSQGELLKILKGANIESSKFPEILEQANALAHQRQAESLQASISEIQSLAQDGITAEESEQIIVLKNAALNFAENIDTIRGLPDGEILSQYLLGTIDEAAFKNSFQTPISPNPISEAGEALTSEISPPTPEETLATQVEASLNTVTDPNATEEQKQEAIETLVTTGDTVSTESQADVSTTVLTVTQGMSGEKIDIVKEQAVQHVEKIAASTVGANSDYIQDQITTLRTTLGNDNPLVARITTAQEEGLISAHEKAEKSNESIPPLSPTARSFYNGTIFSLGLSESEISTLTPAELKTLKNSEVARENFMSFRQTLNNLNLEGIWPFRNQVFKAIGSLDFNTGDADYIGTNEMNIFLTKVMYATTGKEMYKNIPTNFQEIQSKIIIENRLGIFGGVKDVNGVGDGGGIIENTFRQRFAPKDAGILSFNIQAFQDALKNPNQQLPKIKI